MIEAERILCPYCGSVQPGPANRCQRCGGFFDPLSRRLSQQQMGPWFIRDPRQPFLPGCSYGMLRQLIRRQRVGPESVIRGPTTRQFWSLARHVAGVAHLLGLCHRCGASVDPADEACHACGSRFHAPAERHTLGLDPDNPDIEREVVAAREAQAQPTGAEPDGGGVTDDSEADRRAEHAADAEGEASFEPQSAVEQPDPVAALSYLANAPEAAPGDEAEEPETAVGFDEPALAPEATVEAGREPASDAPVASIGHVPVTAGAPEPLQRVSHPPDQWEPSRGGSWVVWLLVVLNVLVAVGIVLLLFWEGPSGPAIPPR